MNGQNSFLVGDWEVLPDANELRRGDEYTKLESRVMSLLEYLYAHRDRVVGRDELVTEVWGKRYLTDHSISVAIAALRQALGDDAGQPKFIKTIYKKGYRLIAPVDTKCDAQPSLWPDTASKGIYAVIVTVIALLAIFANLILDDRKVDVPLIIVKDFSNETGNARDDELAAILTDLVAAELARGRLARVQKQVPIKLLGLLGDPISESRQVVKVSGRLMQDRGEIHLSVYLEDGASSEIIWSAGRLVDRSNSLSTARTVSKNMLANLLPLNTPKIDAPLTGDELRLQEMYQLAINLAGIRSHATSKAAHGILMEALQLNPEYGPAHSLLAYLYTLEAPEYWGTDSELRFENAESELMLAREFKSNEAHNLATEALLSSMRDGRYDVAITFMERANVLAPDDPWVLRMNLMTDIVRRDFDQALLRNMRAAQLSIDPSSVLAERIVPLYFSGRYEEAVELYEATQELDLLPVFHGPQAAVLAGDHRKGFSLWVDILRAHNVRIDEPIAPLELIASGQVGSAYEWLEAQLPANPTGKNAALIRASWLITSGDEDGAMQALLDGARKLYGGPEPGVTASFLWSVLQSDPIFEELKGDPRMAEVLDLVGVVSTMKAANARSRPGALMPASARAAE